MSWSVTPTLPARKHGPAWSTAPATSARRVGTGWFNVSSEKVASLSGQGTLSVSIVISNRPIAGAFSGRGTMTAVVAPKQVPPGVFGSTGTLIADVVMLRSITVNFSAGTGGLIVAVNEGLTAIIEGGAAPIEGLSATVGVGAAPGGVAMAAAFNSSGALVPAVIGYQGAEGWLTATVNAGVAAALAGSGALSATVTPRYTVSANFNSSGALVPVVIGYQGAEGWLTATVSTGAGVPSFPVAAALTGSGTLSATVKPRGVVSATFTANGALTATVVQRYGIAAQFGDP